MKLCQILSVKIIKKRNFHLAFNFRFNLSLLKLDVCLNMQGDKKIYKLKSIRIQKKTTSC